jgi:hypothetical protein
MVERPLRAGGYVGKPKSDHYYVGISHKDLKSQRKGQHGNQHNGSYHAARQEESQNDWTLIGASLARVIIVLR